MSRRQHGLLLFLGPPRHTKRARFVCRRELGAHSFAQSADFGGAVLPLQPVELRFARDGPAGGDDVASAVKLRGRAGRCAARCGPQCIFEQLFRRDVLVLSERSRSVRSAGERRERIVAAQLAGQRKRGAGGVFRWRSSAAGKVRDTTGRRAILDLPRGVERERHVSAHRCDGADSETELGAARILRALFPACADHNRLKLGAELCGQFRRRRKRLYAAALGARRGAPVRHRDSLPGLDVGRGHVQESREQLPRPLVHW